jgi:two-component system OmpR family response regulator
MAGRILLVDDDVDLVELYQLYLSMHGHEVKVAYSATMALEALRTWAPDVAMLDVRMPDMDGFDLVRLLRAQGHRFGICLYTAYDTAEAVRTASTLDVQDLIFKPAPPAMILTRLEMAMHEVAAGA